MLASGGVVLGLAYLTWVLVVGVSLVRGLTVPDPRRRSLVGAFGGAWLAYIIQSAVSIDVVPLALVGWVLGGVVVLLGWPELAGELTLFRTVGSRGRRSRTEGAGPRAIAVGAVATVLGLVAVWLVTNPLRADQHRAGALQAAQHNDFTTALSRSRSAVRTFSTEPANWADWARYLGANSRQGESLAAIEHAARADPRELVYLLGVARIANATHQLDMANTYYGRVLRVAPEAPDVFAEVARFKLAAGRPAEAATVAQRALNQISAARGVPLSPTVVEARAPLWDVLGAAREQLGDRDGARKAYEAALAIDPTNREAKQALARLSA
jgi:tetratricopeptide (TPR) repeat protein